MGKRARRLFRLAGLAGILSLFAWTGTGQGLATDGVAPAGTNMLDCNGWSAVYKATKPNMRGLCTDPFAVINGKPTRFYDNGYYVGHDEPSVKFISSAPGSAAHMTYYMQLARDPAAQPTANGSVTDYAELSAAPWFGLPICDPNSYPQNPCTPASDSNLGSISNPNDAGSAFMELQFYPPGFGPFQDAFSCDQTYYCAALTIDSLECTFNFLYCNRSCVEPVNFAYIQTDGQPTGPPSPQLMNASSFHPNGKTLRMAPGDALKVTVQDTSAGLRATVVDQTTGSSGYMVASAANGFMNTNLYTCNGTAFAFHPEYSSASVQNQVPWAALEGGVLMEHEIGHFEPCNSVSSSLGLSYDPNTYQVCNGGLEPGAGEGPCTVSGCANSTTEGGGACPRGALCENADALCAPQGARQVTLLGSQETWSWPVAGCEQDWFQNGDLDFDGTPYQADWPDGSSNHPTSFRYIGPFDGSGNTYPSIQIETDLGGSEQDCNVNSGAGCTAPPAGAAFYPYWTLAKQASPFGNGKACMWYFGNTIAGVTNNNLGGDAEYGTPDTARYAGTIISAVMDNPQLQPSC